MSVRYYLLRGIVRETLKAIMREYAKTNSHVAIVVRFNRWNGQSTLTLFVNYRFDSTGQYAEIPLATSYNAQFWYETMGDLLS